MHTERRQSDPVHDRREHGRVGHAASGRPPSALATCVSPTM